jgi:hypothetical protein
MKGKPRAIRWALALVAALLLVAMAATLVMANETTLLNGKLRTGDTVTVPASETVDGDLYLAGGTIIVDGTVNGDLAAFGGQVQINGKVGGDLMIGGGTVTVNGDVTGDVRIGGGQVTVGGQVGEDLVVAGGQTTLSGQVQGDLIVSGGTVNVAGNVAGNIEGNAGTYSRSGTVGGEQHVTIGPRGGEGAAQASTSNAVADGIRHFIVLVVIGAFLVWLVPWVVRRSEETLRAQPLLSVGGGVLAWIAFIAFAIVLLLVTVLLAIALGLAQLGTLAAIDVIAGLLTLFAASFAFWLAVAFLADIVVGLALARLVVREPATEGNRWRELGLLVAGAAVVAIVTSLPVIGGLAKLLVVLFGLGALTVAAWRAWRGPGAPMVAAPPPAAGGPAAI